MNPNYVLTFEQCEECKKPVFTQYEVELVRESGKCSNCQYHEEEII